MEMKIPVGLKNSGRNSQHNSYFTDKILGLILSYYLQNYYNSTKLLFTEGSYNHCHNYKFGAYVRFI
jgi:hypothetical protein